MQDAGPPRLEASPPGRGAGRLPDPLTKQEPGRENAPMDLGEGVQYHSPVFAEVASPPPTEEHIYPSVRPPQPTSMPTHRPVRRATDLSTFKVSVWTPFAPQTTLLLSPAAPRSRFRPAHRQ